MSSLRHFSLGEPCPASPHAVVSCLPTMADVHAYEQHDPRVVKALESGYPRFVEHTFIKELICFYLNRAGLERCGLDSKSPSDAGVGRLYRERSIDAEG